MHKDKLIAEIQDAFQGVPYPGDHSICYDSGRQYGKDAEGMQIEAFFKGQRWQDITLKGLHEEYEGDASACLSFMTPLAVKYYLPAYMIIGVEEMPQNDAMASAAMRALKTNRRRIDFTERQKAVIASFSSYLKGKGFY